MFPFLLTKSLRAVEIIITGEATKALTDSRATPSVLKHTQRGCLLPQSKASAQMIRIYNQPMFVFIYFFSYFIVIQCLFLNQNLFPSN